MNSKKLSWFFTEALNHNHAAVAKYERDERLHGRQGTDGSATRNAVAASMAGAPGAFIGGIINGLLNNK